MPFVSSVRGSYGSQDKKPTDGNLSDPTNANRLQFREQVLGTAALGGTLTVAGGYAIYTFTNVGNSTFDTTGIGTKNIEYLVVAGGGGGGAGYYTGAGGAGGMRTGTLSTPATSYTINVGSGGAGGGTETAGPSAVNGSPSTFSSITSIGGGRGGGASSYGGQPGQPGGSGGGGLGLPQGTAGGGTGTPGQGNNGARGGASWCGGGGGGAGGAGTIGSPGGSQGGSGSSSSISGASLVYAAGGHGNRHQQSGYSPRPSGVGGAGSLNCCNLTHNQTLLNAVQSTGSGGGGHDRRNPGFVRAGDGANGVVILRYLV